MPNGYRVEDDSTYRGTDLSARGIARDMAVGIPDFLTFGLFTAVGGILFLAREAWKARKARPAT